MNKIRLFFLFFSSSTSTNGGDPDLLLLLSLSFSLLSDTHPPNTRLLLRGREREKEKRRRKRPPTGFSIEDTQRQTSPPGLFSLPLKRTTPTKKKTFSALVWLPALLLYLLYASVFKRSPLALALLAVALSANKKWSPLARPWPRFEHSAAFDTWRRRHRLRVVTPAIPFAEPRSLFCHFPHGVFPMSALLCSALAGNDATGVPAPHRGVCADVLLAAPVVGLFFRWLGCGSASKKSLMRLLSANSVGLIPEGIAGIFANYQQDDDDEKEKGEGGTGSGSSSSSSDNKNNKNKKQCRVFLESRKGFVKAAIEAGAPLVPCYHFGTADVFSLASPPRALAEKLSRKFRISLIWPAGVLGLPVPRPAPLLVAVGRAVAVEQSAAPTQQQVDEAHARFVRSLRDAFEEHKHLAPGYERSELVVI